MDSGSCSVYPSHFRLVEGRQTNGLSSHFKSEHNASWTMVYSLAFRGFSLPTLNLMGYILLPNESFSRILSCSFMFNFISFPCNILTDLNFTAVLLVEFSWQIVGILWLVKHYQSCQSEPPKKAALGVYTIKYMYIYI